MDKHIFWWRFNLSYPRLCFGQKFKVSPFWQILKPCLLWLRILFRPVFIQRQMRSTPQKHCWTFYYQVCLVKQSPWVSQKSILWWLQVVWCQIQNKCNCLLWVWPLDSTSGTTVHLHLTNIVWETAVSFTIQALQPLC